MADEGVHYSADHVLEYPYVRSVGPAVGAFLTGLRDGKVVARCTPAQHTVIWAGAPQEVTFTRE